MYDTATTNVCRFFATGMHCKYGNNCRYAHAVSFPVFDSNQGNVRHKSSRSNRENREDKLSRSNQQVHNEPREEQTMSTNKLCRFYFKNGWCAYESDCRFKHERTLPKRQTSLSESSSTMKPLQSENDIVLESLSTEDNEKSDNNRSKSSVVTMHLQSKPENLPVRNIYVLAELSDEQLINLKAVEIQQFKSRYRKAEALPDDCYSFAFVPTDPDWPFDVKELCLLVWFPQNYPNEVLKITVAENDRLPATLNSHLDDVICDWLTTRFDAQAARGMVEMMLRPFLHWLDRNLQRLFTEGLKMYQRELMARQAGLQFVSADELKKQYNIDSSNDQDAINDSVMETVQDSHKQPNHMATLQPSKINDTSAVKLDRNLDSLSLTKEVTTESEQQLSTDRQKMQSTGGPHKTSVQPVAKGTEIRLLGLNLGEGVGTLALKKLCIMVQCARCHVNTEISSLAPNQDITVSCTKCHNKMSAKFSAAIAHQFSSVLGYLDLRDCGAFDLVLQNSECLVNCLSCSKDTVLKGFTAGPPSVTWCHHCHQKMQLSTEGVRFQCLDSSSAVTVARKATTAVVKAVKDPAIQVGRPLPEFGVCKHFKKSFRWFRFPCCGKAYPCDECHDLCETDHETIRATRMICGYCAKEQPFTSDKPCVNCLSDLTKRITSFWEGGKGCRDKIKMSRDDPKKYQNVNKTVSRKAQASGSTTVKNTKPRHSSE